ncbi:hypothetical protein HNQ94_003294 [Salirhabdus euzebyi]|uniref:DUF4367 domain-containing protein n=1 Tax=Salirhabdus euzebyi TaxID=394506 RepID=A0A841Q8U1_9BACI|nr:DUF4367 domain-containing protein [Salirhabdus euzebyi]MBB6454805.1 hypothetical protein [Salirhabdus euzebyi]
MRKYVVMTLFIVFIFLIYMYFSNSQENYKAMEYDKIEDAVEKLSFEAMTPTFVPNNVEKVKAYIHVYNNIQTLFEIQYQNENNEQVFWLYASESEELYLSEDEQWERVDLQGTEGHFTVSLETNTSKLLWLMNGIEYSVQSKILGKEELIKIAQSIQ